MIDFSHLSDDITTITCFYINCIRFATKNFKFSHSSWDFGKKHVVPYCFLIVTTIPPHTSFIYYVTNSTWSEELHMNNRGHWYFQDNVISYDLFSGIREWEVVIYYFMKKYYYDVYHPGLSPRSSLFFQKLLCCSKFSSELKYLTDFNNMLVC